MTDAARPSDPGEAVGAAPELCSLSAARIAELVRAGELARREVVAAHAARIEDVNGRVNALVALRLEQALDEADAADRRGAEPAGPLDGVPVSIKDNIDVAGMPTTLGVPSRAEHFADSDEEAARRLRAAGALVLGKGSMPDFALRWNTLSSLHGATRNPRDLGRTVGGSSGGDSAAVAAGMVPLGLGSDYGGSIRVPATWCGVLGLKPTTGLVPKAPTVPPFDFPPSYDLMASIGPVARSVDDLELALELLRGRSHRDPASVPAEPGVSSERPAVALVLDEAGATVDPEVERAVRTTAEALRAAGYRVEEGVAPDLRRTAELWAEIVGTELFEGRMEQIRPLMSEDAAQHVDATHGQFALGPGLADYLTATMERRAAARSVGEWMELYPVVLAPVAGMVAPPLDFDRGLSVAESRALFDRMRAVVLVNTLGLPAVALGNGAQLIGRRFGDRELLAAARAASE